jgi:hypothetical protein
MLNMQKLFLTIHLRSSSAGSHTRLVQNRHRRVFDKNLPSSAGCISTLPRQHDKPTIVKKMALPEGKYFDAKSSFSRIQARLIDRC